TLFPFAMSLLALGHMSAFAAQLAVNLEPIYAIVLAILLLGEQHELDPAFYAGVVIILGAVVAYPLLARPKRIEHVERLATGESTPLTRASPAPRGDATAAPPFYARPGATPASRRKGEGG